MILQNSLEEYLKEYFRIVPQNKFLKAQEAAFEELEYEECTEDQCIMLIQEILQVENVFHLQIIIEENDSQLSISLRTLDSKMKVTDVCFGCGTFQLNEQIECLVNMILEGRGYKENLSYEIKKGGNQGIMFRIMKGDV